MSMSFERWLEIGAQEEADAIQAKQDEELVQWGAESNPYSHDEAKTRWEATNDIN